MATAEVVVQEAMKVLATKVGAVVAAEAVAAAAVETAADTRVVRGQAVALQALKGAAVKVAMAARPRAAVEMGHAAVAEVAELMVRMVLKAAREATKAEAVAQMPSAMVQECLVSAPELALMATVVNAAVASMATSSTVRTLVSTGGRRRG